VRIFKTKWLVRYARRQRIDDASLKEATERADRDLIDADLGGEIIKRRVARAGQGRSGGHRMLVAYRASSLFLYAFAKNERDNIRPRRAADAARDRGRMARGGCAAYRPGRRARDFAGGGQ
jgi:hypothetical protein